MTAAAYKSVPSGDPQYWADISGGVIRNVTFNPAGGNWLASAKSRLTDALNEWNNRTDWNPSANLTLKTDACWNDVACHGVWLDGHDPFGGLTPGVLAYNYVRKDHKQDQADHTWYWDIKDSDVTFNTYDYAFHLGAAQQGTFYDFQGVLTHEIGHAVRLIDLSICSAAPNRETMCGSVNIQQSFDIRSLTADDIASVNGVY